MKAWIPVVALLSAATLVAGFPNGPPELLAQSQPRPTPTPPPPPPRPPRPPDWIPPPTPSDYSRWQSAIGDIRADAKRSAQIDSAVAAAKRVLAYTQRMNSQMSELGTPQTFQNLGLRFERLQTDLYAITRHLRALHEERDDPDFLHEVGPHRMLVMGELVDGVERLLKETERLQRSLELTVLP